MPKGRNLAAVKRFAAQIGVSPGVVIGRIQHETGDYTWGHQLKRRLQFAEPGLTAAP